MATKKSSEVKQKVYKKAPSKKVVEQEPKSIFSISNSAYDVIKKIVAILPLFTALYVALANIWGWGFGEQIDATITAIIAFLNGLLGVFMLASSKVYRNSK